MGQGGSPFRRGPDFFDDKELLDKAFKKRQIKEITKKKTPSIPEEGRTDPKKPVEKFIRQTKTVTPAGGEGETSRQLGDPEKRKKKYVGGSLSRSLRRRLSVCLKRRNLS